MKPHILVVDDSMVVRMDLRGALTEAGCEVTTCATKQAAEALLDARTFDAFVFDVVLPDGDGIEILKRVRADVKHANTPVIMLSNEADVRDRHLVQTKCHFRTWRVKRVSGRSSSPYRYPRSDASFRRL